MPILIDLHFQICWNMFSGPFNPNQFAVKAIVIFFLPSNPAALAQSSKAAGLNRYLKCLY